MNKSCLFCKKELVRRTIAAGRLENVTQYRRRKYCNKKCIAALKKTGVVTSPTYASDHVPFVKMARKLWRLPA